MQRLLVVLAVFFLLLCIGTPLLQVASLLAEVANPSLCVAVPVAVGKALRIAGASGWAAPAAADLSGTELAGTACGAAAPAPGGAPAGAAGGLCPSRAAAPAEAAAATQLATAAAKTSSVEPSPGMAAMRSGRGSEEARKNGLTQNGYGEKAKPKGRFRHFPGSSLTKIWAGRPSYSPEAILCT